MADGFPLKNVVTSDLKQGKRQYAFAAESLDTDSFQEFVQMGHTLFNTTSESYPLNFVPGDIFDPDMLQIVPPFDKPPSTQKPDLSTLMSLNPLAGRCAVIYAANFFHLFSEENQLHLAKALAGLLSPQPGSMICGEHTGNTQKGVIRGEIAGITFDMFRHSPESWNAIWDGEAFAKGQVRASAKLYQVDSNGLKYDCLQWSVVRL